MRSEVLLAGLLLLSASLWAGGKSEKAGSYELSVGTSQGENSTIYKGLAYFKKNVESANQNIKIHVYPSNQLGGEEDVIEQAKLGAAVGVITDNGRLSEYVRELGVVGVAYAADSYQEMKKITESELYRGWSAKLSKHNLQLLAMNWFQGSRNFYTNKKVTSPDDLHGLLIRVPAPPVWQKSIAALGATPVALAWPETYPAMQQKVVDGFEVQTTAAYASSLQETVKYLIKTGHFQLMSGIVIGYKFFMDLPKDLRDILVREAVRAGDYESELELSLAKEDEKEFVEKYGMEIVEVDTAPFKKAAQQAYSELGYVEELKALRSIP